MNIQDRVTVNNVYIKPDGQICACIQPVPEKPNTIAICRVECKLWRCTCQLYTEQFVEYNEALQACKDSSVPFDNQIIAKQEFFQPPLKSKKDWIEIKLDTFYPLQCSIQIVDYHCPTCGYAHSDAFLHLDHHLCKTPMPKHEKVARLIPEAKPDPFDGSAELMTPDEALKKIVSEAKVAAPIVEESQEFLLHLIDVVSCFVSECGNYYSTKDRLALIEEARKTFKQKESVITRKP